MWSTQKPESRSTTDLHSWWAFNIFCYVYRRVACSKCWDFNPFVPSGKRLQKAIEHGPVEIVFRFPMKKWWISPVRYVNVDQRVNGRIMDKPRIRDLRSTFTRLFFRFLCGMIPKSSPVMLGLWHGPTLYITSDTINYISIYTIITIITIYILYALLQTILPVISIDTHDI